MEAFRRIIEDKLTFSERNSEHLMNDFKNTRVRGQFLAKNIAFIGIVRLLLNHSHIC